MARYAMLCATAAVVLGAASGALAQDVGVQPQPQGAPQGPPGGPGRGGPPAHGDARKPPPPAEGGTVGAIDSMSASDFVVSTSTGLKVTVEKTPSTIYRKGAIRTSARAIKSGDSVLVFGMVDLAMTGGTTKPTIAASQVIVQPAGKAGSAALSTTNGTGFRTLVAKQVGLIPPATQERGMLVNGTEADKATEAALGAYAGGLVNRVVKLSDSVYDVHNAAISWPHNIYVDQDFKYVGAK